MATKTVLVMMTIILRYICQAPNPDEIGKTVFNYEIQNKAKQSHDRPRLIIQETRLTVSSDAAIIVSQYAASMRVIQCIRRDKNISTEPKTFADLIIPLNFQNTITNQKFLL